eukprot:PhF_6_TR40642/c0_g1_i5/m.61024
MVERFKAFGVTLVFVIDGSRGVEGVENSRNDTWDRRETERFLESQQRYDYCAGTEHDKPKQLSKLLLTSQMKHCLSRLGVECLVLDGEVDLYVGALLRKYPTQYFMTGDTDFVAIDGVVTIMNQMFPWNAFLGHSAPQRVDVPTTKASRLIEFCQLQGLPQLWRIAAFAGNDLTKGKLHPSFDGFEDALDEVLSGRAVSLSEEQDVLQQSFLFYRQASDPNRTLPTPKNTLEVLVSQGQCHSRLLAIQRHHVIFYGPPPWSGYCPPSKSSRMLRLNGIVMRLVLPENVDTVREHWSLCGGIDGRKVFERVVPKTILDADGCNVMASLGMVTSLEVIRALSSAEKFRWMGNALHVDNPLKQGSLNALLLWLLAPVVCDFEELRIIASMLVILQQHDKTAYTVVCTNEYLQKKPTTRCLELAMTFAKIY